MYYRNAWCVTFQTYTTLEIGSKPHRAAILRVPCEIHGTSLEDTKNPLTTGCYVEHVSSTITVKVRLVLAQPECAKVRYCIQHKGIGIARLITPSCYKRIPCCMTMCQCVMVHRTSYVATRKDGEWCVLNEVEMIISHELYLRYPVLRRGVLRSSMIASSIADGGTDADTKFCLLHCPAEMMRLVTV